MHILPVISTDWLARPRLQPPCEASDDVRRYCCQPRINAVFILLLSLRSLLALLAFLGATDRLRVPFVPVLYDGRFLSFGEVARSDKYDCRYRTHA